MAVSKRLRFEVLRRDNHTCRYCGRSAPEVKLQVDHVVPETLGGSDDPSNLVAACVDCNGGKSSVPAGAELIDDVAEDALRWAKAIARAAEVDRRKRSDDDLFVADFANLIGAIIRSDPDENTYCMPDLGAPCIGGAPGFKRTVLQFRDSGLNLDDLEYAIKVAGSNRAISDQHNWKYFCGICWRMVEDRQATARSILNSGGL